MKYRIVWRSKETGATGRGKPVFNTKAMADRTTRRLNKEYPDMHYFSEAVSETQATSEK